MGLLILGSQHLAKSSAQEPRAVLVERINLAFLSGRNE